MGRGAKLKRNKKEKGVAAAKTHIRFLISNSAAGCIIGKGGSTISEFQSQSGARIQLSRNHEVEESNDVEGRPKVRLIIPNSSCGAIIGKGGSTIKSFIEDSRAGIKISPQDTNAGLNDRLVTLTGSFEEQMRAIYLILAKLIEDAHYPQTLNSAFTYSGANYPGVPVGYMIPSVAYGPVSYGPNGVGGKYPINKGVASPVIPSRSPGGPHEGQSNSVTIGIADEHIGAVVGRGGRNITEISQVSGARIKISDRGDFVSGTSDRKVTITGSPEAIRVAEAMIMQKVSSNSER
ncbi:hypothetical protein C4D60_Mb03t14220 [Musa balbisiana]|uniref:K Homology domain-containing protein n=1 Tax=Musa balbisiana TaxID=52838 RepID=A0A4S8JA73_MUSBA|nr:hypothetical protein C4D60_Mb03t14220 [Musa balbisiana]